MQNKDLHPFFSVLICTYNRADIIKRALDSLLQQTCTDWEGLIIDDGSTDSTQDIIQSYLEKFPLHYYKKTHSGLAESRNFGITKAKGKYITFLDTDDEYEINHLQIRHELLKGKQDIDLLHSNVTIIGDPYLPDKNNPKQKIHINDCSIGGTFFIKRDRLSPSDSFQDRYSDDSHFLEQFARQGKNILKIEAPTYLYYRDMEDSLCNQKQG